MNRLLKIHGIGLIILLTLSACGTDTDTFLSQAPEITQISSIERGPVNSNAVIDIFVQNVSRMGVRLNDNQLKEISIQRHVPPSGFWASRPALNLTAEQNLNTHFIKHRSEFKGVTSPAIYLQRALEFQRRQSPSIKYYFDTTSFDKGYQSNIVKYDSNTTEMGAVRDNGDITTYYTSEYPSRARFIVVPEEFSF